MSSKKRKIYQLTEYDEFADKTQLADRYTFLENIKTLSKYSKEYKEKFKDILKMSNTVIELKRELSYDEFISEISRIYRCTDDFSISAIYNAVCTMCNFDFQKYTNYDEMKKIIYSEYTCNYEYFIEILQIALENPSKWYIREHFKNEEELKKIEIDNKKIPEVPKVPI